MAATAAIVLDGGELGSETETEVVEVTVPTKECPVTTVTVYADRAEVTRTVTFRPTTHGQYSVVVTGLTDAADKDSVRVSGVPSRASLACTIQEVTFDVNYRPQQSDTEKDEISRLEAELKSHEDRQQQDQHALSRLQQQDVLMQSYMNSMLTKSGKDGEKPTDDLDVVRKLFSFHAEQGKECDQRQRELQCSIGATEKDMKATKMQLSKLTSKSRNSMVQSRDVSIAISIPHVPTKDTRKDAASDSGSVVLALTYIVTRASWVPKYDLRAEMAKSTLGLTYYGVVKQSTGEDWNGVSLCLSTASPSVGGTPPLPPTRTVQWKENPKSMYGAQRNRMMNQVGGINYSASSNVMIPQQAMMAPLERRNSLSANELLYDPTIEDDDSSDDDDEDFMSSAANVATASVKTGGGGSATFSIERKATIASDNKEHKVTVAIVDTVPTFRHFATPALEEKVYLQARAVNASPYQLLPSSRVSLFIDGSFVTTTALKHVSPGETFNIFLGVDASVKVEHKLIKKSSNKGTEGGMFKGKQSSRLVQEYRTIVQNTSEDKTVDLCIVQLLPRSSDDKIKVDLLTPAMADVKSSDVLNADTHGFEGSDSKGSGKEGDKRGASDQTVILNKITNNVVIMRKVAAKEKADIPFHYSVQWPVNGGNGEGIEIK